MTQPNSNKAILNYPAQQIESMSSFYSVIGLVLVISLVNLLISVEFVLTVSRLTTKELLDFFNFVLVLVLLGGVVLQLFLLLPVTVTCARYIQRRSSQRWFSKLILTCAIACIFISLTSVVAFFIESRRAHAHALAIQEVATTLDRAREFDDQNRYEVAIQFYQTVLSTAAATNEQRARISSDCG